MAIKKELILSFVAIFFITTYCGISFNNEKSYDQLKNVQCLNRKTKFMNALTKQKQGIVMIRNNVTNITNYETTIANIPIHFNEIWRQQFTDINPIGLQADPTEKKYFLRLNNSTSNHDCMVVTMGVGQTVDAELALKQIYPQCKFLALDPVSDVNADLVEKKLNGTFVQRVITAEDGYSANTRPASIWNSEGKSEFNTSFNELSIGFFDFFLFYNAKPIIDMLSLDVEGSEFAIFQLLAEEYDQLPVIICQLNIEFHHTPHLASSFLRHRFFRNFDLFIRNNRFALMKSDVHDVVYHAMFFVNFVDKICLEKYLC